MESTLCNLKSIPQNNFTYAINISIVGSYEYWSNLEPQVNLDSNVQEDPGSNQHGNYL